jgi:integrase
LIGFAGAFRRSELVALNCSDILWAQRGIEVVIRRYKTDGVAEGRTIGIPFGSNEESCPVRSLEEWLLAAANSDEPIFREVNRHGKVSGCGLNGDSIARTIKRAARLAGYDPTNLAGHSHRSGHVTQGAIAHVDEATLMDQTGHTSVGMLRRYLRIRDVFALNSASYLGL